MIISYNNGIIICSIYETLNFFNSISCITSYNISQNNNFRTIYNTICLIENFANFLLSFFFNNFKMILNYLSILVTCFCYNLVYFTFHCFKNSFLLLLLLIHNLSLIRLYILICL